ncbi:MAG TPA: DUF2845 domain-containing protein [Candidatus Tectomicrobia bacterium]
MRRMVWVAIVMLVVTIGSLLALDCHGRLVVIGTGPWEVKDRCGEPAAIDDVMKHIPQRAYDSTSQSTVDILVPVQRSIWTYNFGETRFLYDLTFQEGKLIDITTGDDGYDTGERRRRESPWPPPTWITRADIFS